MTQNTHKRVEEFMMILHKAWMTKREQQGYHRPAWIHTTPLSPLRCVKCDDRLVPFEELSQEDKELYRSMAEVAMLSIFNYFVVPMAKVADLMQELFEMIKLDLPS